MEDVLGSDFHYQKYSGEKTFLFLDIAHINEKNLRISINWQRIEETLWSFGLSVESLGPINLKSHKLHSKIISLPKDIVVVTYLRFGDLMTFYDNIPAHLFPSFLTERFCENPLQLIFTKEFKIVGDDESDFKDALSKFFFIMKPVLESFDFEIDEYLNTKSDGRKESSAKIYPRDQNLSELMKKKAGYKCQICGFSIYRENDIPYVESHHIIPLGERGEDIPENILVVCPNHHMMLHYAPKSVVIQLLNCCKRNSN